MGQGQTRFIRFGGFVFDPESDELFCGESRVPLQPKPARLLALFLSRPGRLLTPAEITESLWPDTVVDYEQRIRSAVREIRTALGDDAENPTFIATVPRRGYRFVHAVKGTEDSSVRFSKWPLAAAFLVAILSLAFVEHGGTTTSESVRSRDVLAVLPVRDISSPTAAPGVSPAAGLTHILIADAARLAPDLLAVIGPSSVAKFEQSDQPASEIAMRLGANYLLETTLDREEANTSLVVTLAATASRQVVWSSRFEGTPDRLQDFEKEILAGIATSLLSRTGPSGARDLRRETSARAYDAYLRGLYYLEKAPPADRPRSYESFQKAVEDDPHFAPALVGLARAGRAIGRPEGEFWEAMDKAAELDATLSDPYYYRAAHAFMQEWDWEAAERGFQKAIQLDPGRAKYHAFYSAFLRASGRLEQARGESERALTIDPLSELAFRDMAWLHLDVGDYRRAIEHCGRALELGLEDPSSDHRCSMLAYLQLGDISAATDHAREIMVLGGAGDDLLNKWEGLSPDDRLQLYWQWSLDSLADAGPGQSPHIRRAMTLSAMGRSDDALDELEASLKAHEPSLVFIVGDLMLAPLRAEPRFRAVARAVGIPRTIE